MEILIPSVMQLLLLVMNISPICGDQIRQSTFLKSGLQIFLGHMDESKNIFQAASELSRNYPQNPFCALIPPPCLGAKTIRVWLLAYQAPRRFTVMNIEQPNEPRALGGC